MPTLNPVIQQRAAARLQLPLTSTSIGAKPDALAAKTQTSALLQGVSLADLFAKADGMQAHAQPQPLAQDLPSPQEVLGKETREAKEFTHTRGYAPSAARNQRPGPAQQKSMVNLMTQKMSEIQKTMSSLLGDPQAFEEMAQTLGPNACFEDVLSFVMMKIAREEEKKVMERISILENGGHPGVKGWVSHKAADLGGLAGGVLGAMKGGAAGAAVGQDVGKRLVNSFSGYNSEDSRQIQFEKLKQQMNKLNELMSIMSNILANMHQTAKNTIGNIRA
ncbi:MAG: hypothetical protein V4534_03795 [Myxococcota bacterium]